jgi:hypothetical protein
MIKKVVSVVAISIFSLLAFSQQTENECGNLDEKIIAAMALTVQQTNDMSAKSDPYGLEIAIQVSSNGHLFYNLPTEQLTSIATAFANSQNFDRYHVNGRMEGKTYQHLWHFKAGSNPALLSDKSLSTIEVNGYSYSCKQSLNGQITKVTIQTRGLVYTKTPQDGSLTSSVYYYDADGTLKPWSTGDWRESVLAYERVGPGTEITNSKLKKEKPINGNEVEVDELNPGHYLPELSSRGCSQNFVIPERFDQFEGIVELESNYDDNQWQIIGGKAYPKPSIKASISTENDFYTFYSKGNIVEGAVFDDEGKPMKEPLTVILERQFPASFDLYRKTTSKSDGTYRFENTESGIYHVYVEGYKHESYTEAAVCNDPHKGEGPNYTYSHVDINAPLQIVFLIETTENYTEIIEPLLLEGGYHCPQGTISRISKAYSLVRINSMAIDDFFGTGFANSVVGSPADDRNRLISLSGKSYSFYPGAETALEMIVERMHNENDFNGTFPETYIWPENVPSDRLFMASDKFRPDSVFNLYKLNSKMASESFQIFFGAGVYEGKVIDIEIVSHDEGPAISFGELYRLARNGSGSIKRKQKVEYKEGYNTHFLGMGQFMKPDDAKAVSNLISDLDVAQKYMDNNMKHLNEILGGQLFPDGFSSKIDNTPMDTFLKTAFNEGKNSGMFESLAKRIKIQREITISPIDAQTADRYFAKQQFEIKPQQKTMNLDEGIDSLKEVLKLIMPSN